MFSSWQSFTFDDKLYSELKRVVHFESVKETILYQEAQAYLVIVKNSSPELGFGPLSVICQ